MVVVVVAVVVIIVAAAAIVLVASYFNSTVSPGAIRRVAFNPPRRASFSAGWVAAALVEAEASMLTW